MTEHWLPVTNYEGLYDISDQGRVWSHIRGRLLKPRPTEQGVLRVVLCGNGEQKERQISRLVLTEFDSPCPDGLECCHRDDDPKNNWLYNLRWDTRRANTFDKIRNGGHPQVNKTCCPAGHRYISENTYFHTGRRHCRKCRRAQCRASYRRNKETP